MRQVRKEERKEERRQARRDRNAAADEQEFDQEMYLRAVGFDPESMKTQRYVAVDTPRKETFSLMREFSNFYGPYLSPLAPFQCCN